MPDLRPPIICPEPRPGVVWVYILQTIDGTYYVGQSCNLRERLRKHRLGLGSKHTHDHPDPRLIYVEPLGSLSAAVSREAQLKRWTRAKKEALIRADAASLKRLARSRDHDG